MPSQGEKSVLGSVEGQGQYACRLELDMNTAQEHKGELPKSALPGIFQELCEYGEEIADKGDVA